MFFPRRLLVYGGVCFLLSCPVLAQESQRERARQVGRLDAAETFSPSSTSGNAGRGTSGDDSFGVQEVLRETQREQPFTGYADVAGLVTSNVGLTRRDAKSDTFLVATLGLGYRHALPAGLKFEAEVSVTAFRYHTHSVFDFNDLEVTAGFSYHTGFLGGIDLYAGYNYSDLSTRAVESFFTSHALEVSAQKSFTISSAQSAYVGVSGELNFSDPESSERREYAAYAGYRLRPARNWDVNLLYRYAFYDYSEGGRGDHNQTVTLGARYRFTDYFSAYATSYIVINNSNDHEFNYVAPTAGLGLTLRLTF